MQDNVLDHFGQWGAVVLWILLYGLFIIFLPFYKKSERRPTSVYLAFVVAFALEMFGVPLSMYVIAWLFGSTLPDGILWGHTLGQTIGLWGMYIGIALSLIGALLVIVGWSTIYKHYWKQEAGQGKLVTQGIYGYIRHPQYTGFMLITLGMMAEWVTLPLLIMWPILGLLYYRLARREEKDMEREFGAEYVAYKAHTGMFLPRLFPSKPHHKAPIH